MNAIFEKDKHTIGEFVSAVLKIDNEKDAAEFAREYLQWLTERQGGFEPYDVMRSNIGWCFGEGMRQERIEMWNRVCNASHPLFGTTKPSVEQALAMGLSLGAKK